LPAPHELVRRHAISASLISCAVADGGEQGQQQKLNAIKVVMPMK
jgi:hypothetical protein